MVDELRGIEIGLFGFEGDPYGSRPSAAGEFCDAGHVPKSQLPGQSGS
jgi:hypothetical protein